MSEHTRNADPPVPSYALRGGLTGCSLVLVLLALTHTVCVVLLWTTSTSPLMSAQRLPGATIYVVFLVSAAHAVRHGHYVLGTAVVSAVLSIAWTGVAIIGVVDSEPPRLFAVTSLLVWFPAMHALLLAITSGILAMTRMRMTSEHDSGTHTDSGR